MNTCACKHSHDKEFYKVKGMSYPFKHSTGSSCPHLSSHVIYGTLVPLTTVGEMYLASYR